MNWENNPETIEVTNQLHRIISEKNLTCILVVGDNDKKANPIPQFCKDFVRRNHGVAKNVLVNHKKNHSKFLIFENIDLNRVDPSENYQGTAFLTSSSNFGENSKINTANLVKINQRDFDLLVSYFQKLKHCAKHSSFPKKEYETVDVDGLNGVKHTSLQLFPGYDEEDEDVHPYEDKIRIKMTRPRTIKIVSPRFHNNRLAPHIAQKLKDFPDLKVSLVVRKGSRSKPEIFPEILALLRHKNCYLYLHDNTPNCHAKFMLYDGFYRHGDTRGARSTKGKILWTGSMNLTSARWQWEQILKTTDRGTIREYESLFESLTQLGEDVNADLH